MFNAPPEKELPALVCFFFMAFFMEMGKKDRGVGQREGCVFFFFSFFLRLGVDYTHRVCFWSPDGQMERS